MFRSRLSGKRPGSKRSTPFMLVLAVAAAALTLAACPAPAPTAAPAAAPPTATEAPEVAMPTEAPEVAMPTEAPEVAMPTEAPEVATPTEAPTEAPTAAPPEATVPAVVPSVTVADQEVMNGTITVAEVVSDGPGWIVIHAQADGKPGPILGYTAVAVGANENVVVEIDVAKATDTLYAMLHTDAGQVGTFEFPGGPDIPVKVNGQIVTPAFRVTLPAAAAAPAVVLGGNDELGAFLIDANGMTLYLFLKDEPGKSNCYDACAQNWPPLLVEGEPVAGEGLDAALLGTTTRDDGSVQVTYNGWPLYYFVGDQNPGDTNGQDVKEVWYVVGPDGEPIHGQE